MEQGREVRVFAHCLLNPFTRVRGLQPPPEIDRTGTVVQLPCPEALYMGLDRWAVTGNQMNVPSFRRFSRSLIVTYADLMQMMAEKGFKIKIVGIAGSPSCGVFTTSAGYTGGHVRNQPHEHVPGPGVFMEELMDELKQRGVHFECSEADDETSRRSLRTEPLG